MKQILDIRTWYKISITYCVLHGVLLIYHFQLILTAFPGSVNKKPFLRDTFVLYASAAAAYLE